MAGTSTAVGVDAVGALFWNPATMSGLQRSEIAIGSNLIIPHNGVTSTIPAGALGPNLGPAQTISGRTNSDNNLTPTTALALVYRPDGSALTYGLGLTTAAAGGVNYPGDPNNPILAPRGPLNQFILGPQAASLTALSITPSAAYQVTDRLAVGGGPIVSVCSTSFDPAFFATPTRAAPGDPLEFPTGTHSKPFWGGGFRGGFTYRTTEHLTAGFSYTSPVWYQTWEFNARNANGDPFNYTTRATLPQIFSAGLAYDGIRCLMLAADVRYIDSSTCNLFGDPVREGGAGWSSVWAASFGAKYQLTERLSVQGGSLYNDNPISGDLALFNTQLPVIT
jgi:long-chain fatty acid transport protein